jgi:hypothetical protein
MAAVCGRGREAEPCFPPVFGKCEPARDFAAGLFFFPRIVEMRKFAVPFALLAGLSGCASLGAQDTENMLSAAQFSMKPATTPAQLANLKTLPQNRIITQVKNGKVVYVYADAAGCQCLYVGNEASYQNFQQIKIAKNIASDQLMAAEMNQQASLDWGAWGPWGPGFY